MIVGWKLKRVRFLAGMWVAVVIWGCVQGQPGPAGIDSKMPDGMQAQKERSLSAAGATVPIDASAPDFFETATFGMG